MKKLILSVLFIVSSWNTVVLAQKNAATNTVKATIDLINVKDDKVLVTISAPAFGLNEVIYQIPKTVPGTYSSDNYGKYIEGFKAFDKKGKELKTSKTDENTWKITNAKALTKITYLVNDTYDIETDEVLAEKKFFRRQEQIFWQGKISC